MRARRICWSVALGLACLPAAAGGEIHGTVRAAAGELSGPMRWDRNENFWDDRLDGLKPEEPATGSKGFQMSLFGLRIGATGDSHNHAFSVPFGHLRSVERLDGARARITLKSGERFDVRAGSSDFGDAMRQLEVADASRGRVKLEWDDIERVDFSAGQGPGRDRERLFGTVQTEAASFTGFVVWDRDESLAEDVLDGNDGKADRKIRFAEIRAVEPRRAGGSKVRLADGSELVLEGTNDVDSGQRGVAVTVAGLGVVDIAWRQVVRVTFTEPPPSPRYADFDGGGPIRGTVSASGGRKLSGRIVWDRDESHTWELLDGQSGGIDHAIPFANLRSIERVGTRGVRVVLRDRRTLELTGTNDVDEGNRGIVVSAEGETTELSWEAFERLDLE